MGDKTADGLVFLLAGTKKMPLFWLFSRSFPASLKIFYMRLTVEVILYICKGF